MAYNPACKDCSEPMTGTIAAGNPNGVTMENNRIECPHCGKTNTYGPETVWKEQQ